MSTVKLQISEITMLNNLRHAFNDSFSWARELAQNSRRAKASMVKFSTMGEDTIVVVDDGRGIDNMQDILHVGHSGWDSSTKEREHPYGLGFLSALYSAEHVKVESKGQCLAFSTRQALQQEDIHLLPSEVNEGTKITLTGINYEKSWSLQGWLNTKLNTHFRGFALPVFLNGEEIERPHRKTSTFEPVSGVGSMLRPKLIRKSRWVQQKTNEFIAYYQGFKVIDSSYGNSPDDEMAVFHLYEKEFQAKLPDRTSLVEPDEARRKIRNGFSAHMRTYLESWFKTTDGYWDASVARVLKLYDSMDLYNTRSYLPLTVTRKGNRPVAESGKVCIDHPPTYVDSIALSLDRVQKVLLYKGGNRWSGLEDHMLAHWQALYVMEQKGMAYHVDPAELDRHHWLKTQKTVYDVSSNYGAKLPGDGPDITPEGEGDCFHITPNGVELINCERVKFEYVEREFRTSRVPVRIEDKIFIPHNCQDWDHVVGLVGACEDEKGLLEWKPLYRLWSQSARANTPEGQLEVLLLSLTLDDIKEGRYTLQIEDGRVEVLEHQPLIK